MSQGFDAIIVGAGQAGPFALIRCELRSRYSGTGSWQLSAKGALSILVLAAAFMVLRLGN
jgi:hypothetical protein